ncbi:Neutral protease precursor [Vibrio aerogenes CECT 7868]|uniref:Neutral metalloproteinase n=1 Tax=Vibrio aerogenes CECT 7868 TaxID=1216006 RepID=A0A1M5ZTD8_9VIBR|nr:M4 family metallopeptidase [Vibrio aerogenes]SHI27406.1 Neutral protease precursor [Vibrio aerogenes CECT 7868]
MDTKQYHVHWWVAAMGIGFLLPVSAAEMVKAEDSAISEQALNAQALAPKVMRLSPAETGFTEVSAVTLPNGKKKVRYQQTYHGLPVFNTAVVATAQDNRRREVSGMMAKGIAADISSVRPAVTRQEALSVALNDYQLRNGYFSAPHPQRQSAKLMVRLNENGQAQLVYMVDFLVTRGETKRPFYFIDADAGTILKHWEGLTHIEAKGSGPGGNEKTGRYVYGEDKSSFGITKQGSTCMMETSEVKSVNLNGASSGSDAFRYSCDDSRNYNDYKQINGGYSPINDAQYYGQKIVEMYRDWVNTSPLSFKLVMRVHYGRNYENAFWDGRTMNFGDGGSSLYPLVDINVSAHEVSHGFTEQNSNLVYSGQSGGINEAFSDIAGEAMEYYIRHKVDWYIGSDIMKSGNAMRYFDQPSRDGYSIDNASDYYQGLDVHYSSGVYNRAYYLLSNRSGWNPQKGFQAFAVANQLYWTSDATYESAACGVTKAAKDLNYATSDVVAAFKTVGVDASCDGQFPESGSGSTGSSDSSSDSSPDSSSDSSSDHSSDGPADSSGDTAGGRMLTRGQSVTDLFGPFSSQLYYGFKGDGSTMTVKISGGTGDADLYVNVDEAPTPQSNICSPQKSGNEESCQIKTNAGKTYYIMIFGYKYYSDLTLSLE